MKKSIYTVFIALLAIGIHTNAHAQSFQEGDFALNAGIGLGTTFATYGASFGLPLGAGLEYGVADLETGTIGVGGDFGFISSSGVTVMTFGGRGSYYLTELFGIEDEKVDIYAGLGIYYRSFNVDGFGSVNWGSGVYPAFHAGGRYFFADNIGGFAELGNNWGWLNVGVTFKF